MTTGLTTQTITDRNHSATILVDGNELQLFFDDAALALASVRLDPDRGTIHMFSDVDDANEDFGSWEEAYAALLDWAATDIHEMADNDESER